MAGVPFGGPCQDFPLVDFHPTGPFLNSYYIPFPRGKVKKNSGISLFSLYITWTDLTEKGGWGKITAI